MIKLEEAWNIRENPHFLDEEMVKRGQFYKNGWGNLLITLPVFCKSHWKLASTLFAVWFFLHGGFLPQDVQLCWRKMHPCQCLLVSAVITPLIISGSNCIFSILIANNPHAPTQYLYQELARDWTQLSHPPNPPWQCQHGAKTATATPHPGCSHA